ncbi:stonin-1 [Spea bombifrons]|uniref:stonin-1 n=1 Tax=Spea bombifrons TaxID=233779 RepID=UPI0023491F57|nr:stonin-1 [Spea bombifrons]
MCSTNPESWVTFDDENPFQPPQKSNIFCQKNIYLQKSNGLKLNLSNEQLASASSSVCTTPHMSPVIDIFMSPGPPSNSPLCTPIRDCQGTPCTPKGGTYSLYPISEASQIDTSLASATPLSLNYPLPHPSISNELNHGKYKKGLEHPSETTHFKYFQNDCSFSSPFWNNDVTSVHSPSHAHITEDTDKEEKNLTKQECNTIEKVTSSSQKGLNHSSFSYVCERLQLLKIDPQDLPVCSEKNSPSFLPKSLFRSQRRDGWPFMLRIPEKKNMMSSRQWGPIYLKVQTGGILQMYYEKGLEKPFKEFQLHQFCRLSGPKLENLGVSEKIHTVKIEHVTYVEKRKYHPKPEIVHEAETEQMLKLGTTVYDDLTDFITTVEEELMLLSPISKQKKTYEEPEMVVEIVDNFWGEINKEGKLIENAVVCQVFCLCFINSGIECFLTLNDAELQKISKNYLEKDSSKTWIHIYNCHFHKCVKRQEFQTSRIIQFTPVDACRFELMRFKVPYNGGDLPFYMKTSVVVQGAYIELQAFLNMSSSFVASSLLNSTYVCENITIHFPVPTQWMKALWTVSLQRQRSLKSKVNRRACLGSAYEIESEPVIQVTIGTAKFENAYKAVVWKIDRLPDKNSSHNQPHSLSCKLELGSDQEIPRNWNPVATVHFVIPATCVSGAEVKSMGIENDIQPHKHVIQKACYNIQVEIEPKIIHTGNEDLDKAGDCKTQ